MEEQTFNGNNYIYKKNDIIFLSFKPSKSNNNKDIKKTIIDRGMDND